MAIIELIGLGILARSFFKQQHKTEAMRQYAINNGHLTYYDASGKERLTSNNAEVFSWAKNGTVNYKVLKTGTVVTSRIEDTCEGDTQKRNLKTHKKLMLFEQDELPLIEERFQSPEVQQRIREIKWCGFNFISMYELGFDMNNAIVNLRDHHIYSAPDQKYNKRKNGLPESFPIYIYRINMNGELIYWEDTPHGSYSQWGPESYWKAGVLPGPSKLKTDASFAFNGTPMNEYYHVDHYREDGRQILKVNHDKEKMLKLSCLERGKPYEEVLYDRIMRRYQEETCDAQNALDYYVELTKKMFKL